MKDLCIEFGIVVELFGLPRTDWTSGMVSGLRAGKSARSRYRPGESVAAEEPQGLSGCQHHHHSHPPLPGRRNRMN